MKQREFPPISTRSQAKAAGAPSYFTGKLCKNGHMDIRETLWGGCYSCDAMRQAARRAEDPSITIAYNTKIGEQRRVERERKTIEAQTFAAANGLSPIMSRNDAVAAGLKTYFNGTLCKHKHVAERFVSMGICTVCARGKFGRWAKNNPEQAKEVNNFWKAQNPARVKIRKARSSRKRRILPVTGCHSTAEVVNLFANQEGKCAYCQTDISLSPKTPNRASEDHIDPITLGGTDWIGNIALSCTPCNSRKKNKPIAKFLAEIGVDASEFYRRVGHHILTCEAA